MTCEDYLMQYRRALDDIRDADLRIQEEELRQQRLSANYDSIAVQGSKDANAKLDPLGDLILQRAKLVEQAEEKKQKVRRFIASVGGGSEEDKRSRQILRLYYAEDLDWKDVQRLVRPLRQRRDGRQAPKRKGCVSETTLFRARHDALAKAERAWQNIKKFQ